MLLKSSDIVGNGSFRSAELSNCKPVLRNRGLEMLALTIYLPVLSIANRRFAGSRLDFKTDE